MSRQLDPDTTYMPTLLQQVYHSVPFSSVFYYGANSSGKTRAGINDDLQWATGKNSFIPSPIPCYQWIISPDFKQGKSAIIGHKGADARFAEFTKWLRNYEEFKPEMNRNNFTVIFAVTKSIIEFKSSASGEESHAGAKIHKAHFDEPPQQNVYEEVLMRLVAYQGLMRGTMTATAGTRCWTHGEIWEKRGDPWGTREQIARIVTSKWLKHLEKNGVAKFSKEGYLLNHAKSGPYNAIWYNHGTGTLLINPSVYDNINQETGKFNLNWEEIRKKEITLSNTARLIRLDGQPATHEGLVFDVWDTSRHLIKPFEIPKHWDHYLGVDYGSTMQHVFAGMHMVLSPEGKWYVIDEYTNGTGIGFKRCAREMKAQWPEQKWWAVVDDSRGKMHRYSLRDEGIYPMPTKAKPEERYQAIYEQLDSGNLFVFQDKCPRLEEEMRKFSYPDQSRRDVPTDVPRKLWNDCLDSIGGVLTWPHLPPPEKKNPPPKTEEDYMRERLQRFEEREMRTQKRARHLSDREGGETAWNW